MGKKKASESAVAVEDHDALSDELDSIMADESEPKPAIKKAAKAVEKDEDEDLGLVEEKTEEVDEEPAPAKKSKASKNKDLEVTEHMQIAIADIVIPEQLLRSVPEEEIEELMASIENDGLLQPILINTDRTLVAGYRRFIAHKKLGEKMISVNVIEASEDEGYQKALIENIQRKQLSTQEEGNAFKKLLEDKKRFPTQKALAKALGISEAKVTFTLKAIGAVKEHAASKTPEKKAKDSSKPAAQKSHRMSEENLPSNVTVLVSKHEVNLGIKIKIKNEAHAKSFTLHKEVATILKEIANSEFCKEMSILREDL